MFILGLIVGIWIGTAIGFIVASLLRSANSHEKVTLSQGAQKARITTQKARTTN